MSSVSLATEVAGLRGLLRLGRLWRRRGGLRRGLLGGVAAALVRSGPLGFAASGAASQGFASPEAASVWRVGSAAVAPAWKGAGWRLRSGERGRSPPAPHRRCRWRPRRAPRPRVRRRASRPWRRLLLRHRAAAARRRRGARGLQMRIWAAGAPRPARFPLRRCGRPAPAARHRGRAAGHSPARPGSRRPSGIPRSVRSAPPASRRSPRDAAAGQAPCRGSRPPSRRRAPSAGRRGRAFPHAPRRRTAPANGRSWRSGDSHFRRPSRRARSRAARNRWRPWSRSSTWRGRDRCAAPRRGRQRNGRRSPASSSCGRGRSRPRPPDDNRRFRAVPSASASGRRGGAGCCTPWSSARTGRRSRYQAQRGRRVSSGSSAGP